MKQLIEGKKCWQHYSFSPSLPTSLSLFLSFSLLTLSNTHTHSHSHTHTHSHSLSHTHTFSLSHTRLHLLTHTHTHTHLELRSWSLNFAWICEEKSFLWESWTKKKKKVYKICFGLFFSNNSILWYIRYCLFNKSKDKRIISNLLTKWFQISNFNQTFKNTLNSNAQCAQDKDQFC